MEFDFEDSGLEIVIEKDHILVKPPEDINVWNILQAIGKIFSMPEFQEKNDIWIFREDKLNLEFPDLYKIKKFAEENYPETSKGKKSAIVSEPGLTQSIAVLFSDIGKDLPREIRVFSDFKSAHDWIAE